MERRIVFVTLSLFGGGAERVVSILSNILVAKSWDVSVILYQRKEREYSLDPRVNLYVLPSMEKRNPIFKRFGYISGLRTIIRNVMPDLVIPFLAVPVIHTFIATRGIRCKMLATVRNNPDFYPPQKLLRLLVNTCTRLSDGLIYQTEEQASFFSKLKNTFVLHNPVSPEMLRGEYLYRPEVKCISTFGRLSEQKNQQVLIRAFAEVVKTYSSPVLKIYGEGEERDRLQSLINQYNLQDSVRLMGSTNNVRERLQETDIFVLSSNYEGLPNALIEAMAVGIPCISTACSTGPKDLICDNENGLLVPLEDEHTLSQTMIKLISSFELRKRLGQNARKTIMAGYTVDTVAKTFESEIMKQLSK